MPVEVIKGNSPVILALPYAGTDMNRIVVKRLADGERLFTAPDRSLDRLLGDVLEGSGLVRARFHRFLSDPEWPDSGVPVGPSKGMLGVVPLLDRDGAMIWTDPPTAREAASWRSTFHVPYHAALAAQIAAVRARFGHAVLITCRARPDYLAGVAGVTGSEPTDIRIANHMGGSSAIDLSSKLLSLFRTSDRLSSALNGRMGAGWSTRQYGKPALHVHALDLELNEGAYLGTGEQAGLIDSARAGHLSELLAEAFRFVARWQPR